MANNDEAERLLPEDGEATVGGVQLPAGSRMYIEFEEYDDEDGDEDEDIEALVAWVTDEDLEQATQAWVTLSAALEGSGLAPVLVDGLDDLEGELHPSPISAVDALDPAEVLARGWEAYTQDRPELGPFPGLAAADGPSLEPDAAAAAVGAYASRLALVPAGRPGDAIAVIGWSGADNYCMPEDLSCVLRSWEDRFGVRLCHVEFDIMTLLVGRPVRTEVVARAVAAEHFAFCADALSLSGADDFDSYAASLVGATTWTFWWD